MASYQNWRTKSLMVAALAGAEHLKDRLEQDGRTFRLKLRYHF